MPAKKILLLLSVWGERFGVSCINPCKAAKFNSINYFSTQDFGIIIQSRIVQDKNGTFLNNQVFKKIYIYKKRSSIFHSADKTCNFPCTTNKFLSLSLKSA